MSVIDAAIRARRDTSTMPEHSPVRSSGRNGVIERGINEVQGQLRAMNSALDAGFGVDIRGTSNILPWMVEYDSVFINRYLVGEGRQNRVRAPPREDVQDARFCVR